VSAPVEIGPYRRARNCDIYPQMMRHQSDAQGAAICRCSPIRDGPRGGRDGTRQRAGLRAGSLRVRPRTCSSIEIASAGAQAAAARGPSAVHLTTSRPMERASRCWTSSTSSSRAPSAPTSARWRSSSSRELPSARSRSRRLREPRGPFLRRSRTGDDRLD
jgi:hypothetical protein